MATKIQIRRDYDYKWLQVNPILAEGEVGFVINTNRIKIGDGKHHWVDLPYLAADSSEALDILKQMEEYTYNKDTIEKKFIDNDELADAFTVKETEILKTVEKNHYTKSEADAFFIKGYDLDYAKSELEHKIAETKREIENNTYSKPEVDSLLNDKQDVLTIDNAGENVYFTKDADGKVKINVSFMDVPGKDVEFKDSDTIEFQEVAITDKMKKFTANVVNVYTKAESDEKFLTEHQSLEEYATKEDVNNGLSIKADKAELAQYATNDALNSVNERFDNYYNKDEVYYSVQTVSNKLDESIIKTKADIESLKETKADKEALNNYATKEDLADIDLSEIENELALKADKSELQYYATKEDLDKVITGGEVDLTNYYTKEETDNVLDNYATKEDLVNSSINFEDSDTVSFETTNGKTSAKVINVYTKKETDDLLSNAVTYKDFTYNGEKRKTIELENHNTISGLDTNGTGHNLVMLSKWDVADFGATGVHMNLNTKDNITINDIDIVCMQVAEEHTDGNTKEETIRYLLNLGDKTHTGMYMAKGYTLAHVNDWNVADFGTSKLHTNLNTNTKIDESKSETGIVTINDDAAILTDKILENVIIGDGIKVETVEIPFGDKILKQLKLSIADDILSRIEALENK